MEGMSAPAYVKFVELVNLMHAMSRRKKDKISPLKIVSVVQRVNTEKKVKIES